MKHKRKNILRVNTVFSFTFADLDLFMLHNLIGLLFILSVYIVHRGFLLPSFSLQNWIWNFLCLHVGWV